MMSTSRAHRAVAGLVAAAAVASAGLRPAGAADLDALRDRARRVGARVTALERRLAGLSEHRRRLEGRIEALGARIARHDLALTRARAAYDAALDRYIERAVEAYKSGPASQLALLLSAGTMAEAATALEATAAAAGADSDAVAAVAEARRDAEAARAEVDSRKRTLLAAEARAEEIAAAMAATVARRRAVLRSVRADITRLERRAQRAAARAAVRPAAAPPGILGGSGPSTGIPDGFVGSGVVFEGIASWYGPGFEGNPTASGDIFDPDLFTAASKELPLGTWLYVEHEGEGVVVLVNDRGPYVGDRVLDLSRAAAFAIGITGLGWVKAEIVFKV